MCVASRDSVASAILWVIGRSGFEPIEGKQVFGRKKKVPAHKAVTAFVDSMVTLGIQTNKEYRQTIEAALDAHSADPKLAEKLFNEIVVLLKTDLQEVRRNKYQILYLAAVTALNASAIKNIFDSATFHDLAPRICAELREVQTRMCDGVPLFGPAYLVVAFERYLEVIDEGLTGSELMMPQDSVVGALISDLGLPAIPGVTIAIGNVEVISPLFLTQISSPLLPLAIWWKRFSETMRLGMRTPLFRRFIGAPRRNQV